MHWLWPGIVTFSKRILWSLWGACAISYQQGNIEQAASHLGDLQNELIERDEWVLANFVDVVKQSLLRTTTESTAEQFGTSPRRPVGDLLRITFNWMQQWGYFSEFLKTVSSPKLKPVMINEQVSREAESNINMVVQMLGTFSLTIQDTLLKLTASRGLSLLKYMLLHHKQSTPREVLMDIFWPDVDPEAARNNLNVAIYTIRKELRIITDVALICHENGAYCLSPVLNLWLDVDEFEKCIKTGKQLESNHQPTAAIAEYEIAVNLYQGDYLAEDPYEEWTVLDRERLQVAYLDTIDRLSQIYFNQERYAACVTLCQRILRHDLCREDAHCRLMQCYSRLGQGHLALRQYKICIEVLKVELDVDPSPGTTQLYKKICQHKQI